MASAAKLTTATSSDNSSGLLTGETRLVLIIGLVIVVSLLFLVIVTQLIRRNCSKSRSNTSSPPSKSRQDLAVERTVKMEPSAYASNYSNDDRGDDVGRSASSIVASNNLLPANSRAQSDYNPHQQQYQQQRNKSNSELSVRNAAQPRPSSSTPVSGVRPPSDHERSQYGTTTTTISPPTTQKSSRADVRLTTTDAQSQPRISSHQTQQQTGQMQPPQTRLHAPGSTDRRPKSGSNNLPGANGDLIIPPTSTLPNRASQSNGNHSSRLQLPPPQHQTMDTPLIIDDPPQVPSHRSTMEKNTTTTTAMNAQGGKISTRPKVDFSMLGEFAGGAQTAAAEQDYYENGNDHFVTTTTNNSRSMQLSSKEDTTFNDTTYINTEIELSVPGYKEYMYDNDLDLDKKIDDGGGSIVFLAIGKLPFLTQYGPQIVVKVITQDTSGAGAASGKNNNNHVKVSVEDRIAFHQEISLMQLFCNHPNFVKFLGFSEEPMSIAMKYYKYKSLVEWMKSKNAPKTKGLIMSFCTDVARALNSMHGRKIAHCDIKPQNILVDKDENKRLFCVLTDFGVSRIVSNEVLQVKRFRMSAVIGMSLLYAAPEKIALQTKKGGLAYANKPGSRSDQQIVLAGDIYALALVIRDIMTRKKSWS